MGAYKQTTNLTISQVVQITDEMLTAAEEANWEQLNQLEEKSADLIRAIRFDEPLESHEIATLRDVSEKRQRVETLVLQARNKLKDGLLVEQKSSLNSAKLNQTYL